MKKFERVLAFLLTVAIIVCGMPLSSSAEEEVPAAAAQQPGIKFVEKGTVGADGILTMTLKVRSSELGAYDSAQQGTADEYTGHFVQAGYFAFQVDATSLHPITKDGEDLVEGLGNQIAYLGYNNGTLDGFLSGKGIQKGSGNFNTDMGCPTGTFSLDESGLMISAGREYPGGVFDCYLQFRISSMQDFIKAHPADAEGYVDLLDLYFQCYSGTEKAQNGKVLFARSVQLPGLVEGDGGAFSSPEAQSLVEQFAYKKDGVTHYLARGAAAIQEVQYEYYNYPEWSLEGYDFMPVQTAYYYEQNPAATGWGADDKWVAEYAPLNSLTGECPSIVYENQENKYIVTEFAGYANNTYYGEELAGETPDPNADFRVPIGKETGRIPRYVVPTAVQEKDLETSAATDGIWKSIRYDLEKSQQKPTPLKYRLLTSVTTSSQLRPEIDGENGLDTFLHNIEWGFVVLDGSLQQVALNDLNYVKSEQPEDTYTIIKSEKNESGTYQDVQYSITEARISASDAGDSLHYLDGKKVQVVENLTTHETMVTPVGITLDFSEKTPISYRNSTGADEWVEGYAPQLRITSKAADVESYLWEKTSGQMHNVYLSLAYHDPSGGKFSSRNGLIQVRVYKDDVTSAAKVDAQVEELKVDDPDGGSEKIDGFELPLGADAKTDRLSNDGIPFTFTITDQYGFVSKKNGTALKPTSVTITNEAGEEVDTFTMAEAESTGGDEYTWNLRYAPKKSINDVVNGKYKVTAQYKERDKVIEWSRTYYIFKADNYFNYIDTGVNTTIDGGTPVNVSTSSVEDASGQEIKRTGTLMVRECDLDAWPNPKSTTATISITELANQWRDPSEKSQNGSQANYDVYPGMRNDAGAMEFPLIRSKFGSDSINLTYSFTDETGKSVSSLPGVSMTGIQSGTFTYNSTVKGGSKLNLTVTVRDEHSGISKSVNYEFTFQREKSKVTKILMEVATGKTMHIQVPTSDEETQQGGPSTLTLYAKAYDQYNTYYDWDDAKRDYPSVGDWELVVENTLPGDGSISQSTDTHKNTISVNHEALQDSKEHSMTLNVYGKFGGTTSAVTQVTVGRAESKVTKVEPIVYKETASGATSTTGFTLYVPDNTDMDAVAEATASLSIIDQFSDPMVSGTDYTVKWRFEPQAEYTGVDLDSDTGKLTVHACAPEIKRELSIKAFIYDKKGNFLSDKSVQYDHIRIRRLDARVSSISLSGNPTTMKYPALTEESEKKFKVTGTTQYGDAEEITSGLEWSLDEIHFYGGEVYKLSDTIVENGATKPKNDIYLDTSVTPNVYTDRKQAMTLDPTSGLLTLQGVGDKNDAPVSVTLSVTRGDLKETMTITITGFDESTPKKAEVWSTCTTTIDVPTKEEGTSTRELNSYLRDQFGFLIDAADAPSPTWTLVPDPIWTAAEQASVRLAGNVITVDNTCPGGDITVRVSYGKDNEGNEIIDEQMIAISKAAGEATSVEIVSMKQGNTTQSTGQFTATLAGLNKRGTGYMESTFTLRGAVRDQFGYITRDAVEWSLKPGTDTYNMVKSVNPDSGLVTFACRDEWMVKTTDPVTGVEVIEATNVPASTEITLVANVKGKPGITAAERTITLKRAPDVASYAVPKRTDYVQSDREGGVYANYILVPSPDYVAENSGNGYDGKTWAKFSATVYSQYGMAMAGEQARIETWLDNGIEKRPYTPKGMTVNPTAADNTTTMLLGPAMTETSIYVKAFPAGVAVGGSSAVDFASSTINMFFDRGAAYANGVVLGTSPDPDTCIVNTSQAEMELWPVEADKTVVDPDGDLDRTTTYTFSGMVVDQYDTAWAANTMYYPIWEFVEEYPGVKFADSNPVDANGHVMGTLMSGADGEKYYQVAVEISHKAAMADLPKGTLSKTFKIRCRVGYNGGIYKETAENASQYQKVQDFTLTRKNSVPTYLFFENIDADGKLTEKWERPALSDEPILVALSNIVRDQYGYLMNGVNVDLALVESSVTNQGASLEPVYETGVDPEDPGDAKPVQYRVILGGKMAVEFTPATREIKLYTACKLSYLEFTASSSAIPNLKKTIRAEITWKDPKPTTAKIQRLENTGAIVIHSKEDPAISENFSIQVVDQYGDEYVGDAAYPMWSLEMKDADGNYVPYMDYDEEGAEKDPQDWMATLQGTSGAFDAILTIRPDQFQDAANLRLVCDVHEGAASNPIIVTETLELQVKKAGKHPTGGGGGGIAGMCTVTYNAGDNGTLRGIGKETVMVGSKPLQVPKIKPSAGYGVLGWITSEGDFVDSPAQVEIWQDMEFTVIYNDITKHTFLTGYDDHTVRPSRAVTRAEFVTMLVRAINNYDSEKEYTHPFKDVDPKRYFNSYIGYAFSLGIVSGDGNGHFRPNDTITRAEASRMVAAAAKITGKTEESREAKFSDVDSEKWYAPYVTALAGAGIINGYTDGTFRPMNQLKRSEAVTLLVQIMEESPSQEELKRIRADGLSPFTDVNKSSWAYPYILRAAGAA